MEIITSRRALLRGGLAGGAVVTIGAAVVPAGGLFRPAAAQEEEAPSEEALAAFAQAVELAAVGAYERGAARLPSPDLQAAIAGNIDHHREHAARFGAVAGSAGQANPRLLQVTTDQLRDAPDEKAAAKVLYDLESGLAGTHLYAIGVSKTPGGLQLPATVLPVESAHAARIAFAIGLPITSEGSGAAVAPTFETEDKRLDPTVYVPEEEAQ